MIDQRVQKLINYCQRQQAAEAANADQRTAYIFVVRHLAMTHQRADDLLAAPVLWSADRRQLAEQIRKLGVGLALADTLEIAAQVFEQCAARLASSGPTGKGAARDPDQSESTTDEAEQRHHSQHVLRVELWRRRENNSKFVRGKSRSREEIEDQVLRRYAIEKPWKDRSIYYLTIPYDTEEEPELIINDEILREEWRIADDRACFVEADVRALDRSERSW